MTELQFTTSDSLSWFYFSFPPSQILSLSLSSLYYCFFPSCFSQTSLRRRDAPGQTHEEEHRRTKPGSACALSFIYKSHYHCSAEQNNSDVMAFVSLCSAEGNFPFWPLAAASGKAETQIMIKTVKVRKHND